MFRYLIFFRITKASSRDFGLFISSSFKEITLSAPRTNLSGCLLLTLIDFNSARIFRDKQWISTLR